MYEYDGYINEWVQAGANSQQGIGLSYRYLYGNVLGIQNTKVDTLENAQKAIGQVDGALNIVAEDQARVRAYQNRFEFSQKYDDIAEENLQDAESRIRDTDMAEEMARFAKEDILEQAGVSMLSQARQQGQQVLSLLNS